MKENKTPQKNGQFKQAYLCVLALMPLQTLPPPPMSAGLSLPCPAPIHYIGFYR